MLVGKKPKKTNPHSPNFGQKPYKSKVKEKKINGTKKMMLITSTHSVDALNTVPITLT